MAISGHFEQLIQEVDVQNTVQVEEKHSMFCQESHQIHLHELHNHNLPNHISEAEKDRKQTQRQE